MKISDVYEFYVYSKSFNPVFNHRNTHFLSMELTIVALVVNKQLYIKQYTGTTLLEKNSSLSFPKKTAVNGKNS